MSKINQLKSGCLGGGDKCFLPRDSEVKELFSNIDSLHLPEGHADMVESSISETMTHLAIENNSAESTLLRNADKAPEYIKNTLNRLANKEATVGDRLAILASDIAPEINSLELGRVHHFMQRNPDWVEEERVVAGLVGEGIADAGLESQSPELHKVRIHDTVAVEGKITGIIASIKMTVARGEDDLLVRHRLKAYVPVERLEKQIVPYDSFGGSREEQILHIQRRLKKVRSDSPDPHLEINSRLTGVIVDTAIKHDENWLTSIYYGCRKRQEIDNSHHRKEFVKLGNMTLRTACR